MSENVFDLPVKWSAFATQLSKDFKSSRPGDETDICAGHLQAALPAVRALVLAARGIIVLVEWEFSNSTEAKLLREALAPFEGVK